MAEPILSQKFDNGLILLGEPIPTAESAAFTIRVPAGSAFEPTGRGGLSALSTELAQRGSGARNSRQFVTDLDNLGVERDATVSDAHASFSGATLARNLLPALAIYGDVLRKARLPEDQFEAARAVCLQEVSSIEDDPAQKVMLELRRLHLPDPWGRNSQGEKAALESITLDEVRGYVESRFRPNGAIIGVAGRFDWQAVVDQVSRICDGWKTQADDAIKISSSGKRREHLTHESNQTQIGIAYNSVPYKDPDYFQAWGAVGVLSGGMSSRLFTEVREKRGLCYTVYATHQSLRDSGSVLCYAGTSAERAQETLDVTVGELLRLAKGIEPNELKRLKARIKSALVMQQESTSARSAALARDWYYLGRVRTLEETGKLVDALTCDTINNYLAAHPPANFTIVTLGSEPLEAPVGIS